MRIRLRGPGGASTLTVPEDATIGDLISQIAQTLSISRFDIKYGYPPKPLQLEQLENSKLIANLDVDLDGEQLTISPKDDLLPGEAATEHKSLPVQSILPTKIGQNSPHGASSFSFSNSLHTQEQIQENSTAPVSLQRKRTEGDVPELPMPERGATMVLRVMPDDNSCLFRAVGAAILPGDDQSMHELRSLVATAIQAEPDVYTNVVLEQSPDDYCRWIQTADAWGGAIEMGILAKHFDLEICSIDVQSLRVDRFNEGKPTRCILVYSGIHYDTIVQSPSDPPHLKADSPPEFDQRIWDSDDDEIITKAIELCSRLRAKHYFTDTGGMAIKCKICGVIVYGERQAAGHAQQTGHYDMAEVSG